MLAAGVLALACPTAPLAGTRAQQLDELANSIRQHNGRLTPANADRLRNREELETLIEQPSTPPATGASSGSGGC